MTKVLMPDVHSWLTTPLISFFKLIKNEHDLTLYDALREFVEFYAHRCAYLGYEDMDTLFLYTDVKYDPRIRKATLNKVFFLSKKAYFIKTWDYTKDTKKLTQTLLTKYKETIPKDFENEDPGLQFFSSFNDVDIFKSKEMLLQFSYQRNIMKKSIVIENDAENYRYESLKYAIVAFDLKFLEDCHFFSVERYQFFRNLLPPNLVIELPVMLDVEMQEIPEQLKREQLIDLAALKA